MSASEPEIEPSSTSSQLPPLPPPLPPPPRPPVAGEGRGAQAARAAAVWARIREARRSFGGSCYGPLHLHVISMSLACAPPGPAPARLICMHIPRRHIPGLNPAAPAAAAGAGEPSRAGEGGGEPGDQVGGRGLGMHRSLSPPDPKYLPAAKGLGLLNFRDGKDS